MKRIVLALPFLVASGVVAHAQTFASYLCADGTNVTSALFQGDKRIRLQFDGHTYALPKRLAPLGTRYAKSGVSFWIRDQEARLKRPKRKATLCKAQ